MNLKTCQQRKQYIQSTSIRKRLEEEIQSLIKRKKALHLKTIHKIKKNLEISIKRFLKMIVRIFSSKMWMILMWRWARSKGNRNQGMKNQSSSKRMMRKIATLVWVGMRFYLMLKNLLMFLLQKQKPKKLESLEFTVQIHKLMKSSICRNTRLKLRNLNQSK